MNSVPGPYAKSTPSAMRQVEGKRKAQYGAFGSMTTKKMLAHPVRNMPTAAKKEHGRNRSRVLSRRGSGGQNHTNYKTDVNAPDGESDEDIFQNA
jgi:hypothetical protein